MFRKQKRIVDKKLLAAIKGKPCCICGYPSDAAHIKSVGAGGDDTPENLSPLCRIHHTEQHTIGWIQFRLKYPGLKTWRDILDMEDRHIKRVSYR